MNVNVTAHDEGVAVKALTIKQPWASLIMDGVKWLENRSWKTNYRGMLGIHAGKSKGDLCEPLDSEFYDFGVLLGFVTIVDCYRLEDIPAELRNPGHMHGPWCWHLTEPVKLKKVVGMRGKQGLWNLEQDLYSEQSWGWTGKMDDVRGHK